MTSAAEALIAISALLFLYIVAIILGEGISRVPQALRKFVKIWSKHNSDEHRSGRDNINSSIKLSIPPLLGMLLAGGAVSNCAELIVRRIPIEWSVYIRKTALAVILTRAGLSLDVRSLRRMGTTTLRLAFVPCITEASVAAVFTKLIRPDTGWSFCFCLGFVLSAVSPAVVVPSLLSLQCEGYGVAKGIPTMILAAASLDDILAICGLGISLDFAFSDMENDNGNSVIWIALLAPISIIGGVGAGLFLGTVLYAFSVHIVPKLCCFQYFGVECYKHNTLILLPISLVVVYASSYFGYDAGGYLCIMVVGFLAARVWNRVDKNITMEVRQDFKVLWELLMPMLFVLIGAQVIIKDITPSSVGFAFAVIFVAIMFRVSVTYLVTKNEAGTFTLDTYERLFTAVAWLPKATVQAALGSVVLDRANELSVDSDKKESAVETGRFVLTVAVLAILLTAPIGAIGIFLFGPRWLHRGTEGTEGLGGGDGVTLVMNDVEEEEREEKECCNDEEDGLSASWLRCTITTRRNDHHHDAVSGNENEGNIYSSQCYDCGDVALVINSTVSPDQIF